ncbi:hypothetical protein [Streptomyces sp. Tu 3180]|uniref:hypothetical protein n=1 Tax=Streptomyces sp. Tu 3180 TaxID=2682611 RepID=UPI001359D43C|nr:hypothetical protein [Streptomyces sp. Tu 3180]KAF3463279.1 hypothetical protein GL259_02070 [Streptomyces sp. Tu 3180]
MASTQGRIPGMQRGNPAPQAHQIERGTTVKATEPHKADPWSLTQFSTRTARK